MTVSRDQKERYSGIDPFLRALSPSIVLKDRFPPVSTVENVIDRSLIFNACFAGHDFTPLLPSAHLQATSKFSILKLTPVLPAPYPFYTPTRLTYFVDAFLKSAIKRITTATPMIAYQ
jgi:hypothetical protein